jgi:hypothetical protein
MKSFRTTLGALALPVALTAVEDGRGEGQGFELRGER